MPARSKSQQRLFGMVHAYQKGELKNVSKNIEDIAKHISEEDAEHFAKTKHKKLPEKKAGAKPPTDLATVISLVKRVLRNKPKPVPLRNIVDAVAGNAVFRGSPRNQFPALQIRHAVETLGIPEKKVLVHVSPSAGVVNEYSGTYAIKHPSNTGADRRGGFLQVIRSGLSDIKKGKQEFSADFGAIKSKQVPPSERKISRVLNRHAMDNPYALRETGFFEARLPARSLSDAKVYVTSVKPGFKGVYRKPDYDNIMLTDITDINRLVKIKARHPEFVKYIDPVISRYTHPGGPMAYSEVKRYLPRNANPFRDPPAWQLPRHLRNLRGTNGRYLFQNIQEKKASAKIDIPALYDEVRKAYADMGYPVSGDRLVVSEQPTYSNGKPVPVSELSPNESGGNTQHDGTVRINPRYRAVMRHWKLKGPGRDFLRTIIGHELGHHIDRSVLSKSENAEERKRLLQEIIKSKFHTVYTDSYGPDTDKRKLDKELLAEYLAKQVADRLNSH